MGDTEQNFAKSFKRPQQSSHANSYSVISMPNKRTIWLSASSVHSWNDPSTWAEYLRKVEIIFGDTLTKLDENDPPRRKANSATAEGSYFTEFNKRQGGKIIFGEYSKKTGLDFTAQIYKSPIDIYGRQTLNRITFYIPENSKSTCTLSDKAYQLFNLTIESLGAFLAESDFTEVIYRKKSHNSGGLDISVELLGIFWLTFFGKTHVDFFTREKLSRVQGHLDGPLDGVTLRLAESPSNVVEGARREAEILLDDRLFTGFDPITDFNKRKLPGMLPTLEQLREKSQSH